MHTADRLDWLDRRLSELSGLARIAAELAILTASAALVIVTAVVFAGARP